MPPAGASSRSRAFQQLMVHLASLLETCLIGLEEPSISSSLSKSKRDLCRHETTLISFYGFSSLSDVQFVSMLSLTGIKWHLMSSWTGSLRPALVDGVPMGSPQTDVCVPGQLICSQHCVYLTAGKLFHS